MSIYRPISVLAFATINHDALLSMGAQNHSITIDSMPILAVFRSRFTLHRLHAYLS